MPNQNINFDVELNIQKIQLAQERILEHHIEFKNMFRELGIALRDEEDQRRAADDDIRHECKEGVAQIYKNVAGYGVTTVIMIVGAIIGYIAYKI